jgi:cell division protein ZapA
MSESRQIEVQIMGLGYMLSVPGDGEAQLREAVQRVDKAMCLIRDAGKIKARDRIAVLAALNLAFDAPDAAAHTSGTAPDPRLDQLLARLDQALGHDGQLL